jgi:hypothetical protein
VSHRSWTDIKTQRAENSDWKQMLRLAGLMSGFDLLEHLDAAGSGMARATQAYRKNGHDDTPLLEIKRSLMELEAVTDELLLRHEAAHDPH